MNMKRMGLIVALVGFAVLSILTADTSAYYHPGLGRWMSRDPGTGGAMRLGGTGPAVGGGFVPRDQYADGLNLYAYGKSAPILLVDPFGLVVKSFEDCTPAQEQDIIMADADVSQRLPVIIHEFGRFTFPYVMMNYIMSEGRSVKTAYLEATRYSNYNREMSVAWKQMKDELDAGIDAKCECECDEGDHAYVRGAFGNTWAQITFGPIHFCPPFFGDTPGERATIFLHELSHLAANTGDFAGSWFSPPRIQLTGTGSASDDAYYFELFMHGDCEVVDKRDIWQWLFPPM